MTTIWLLLGIAVIAQARTAKKLQDYDYEELEWPSQYSLKAIRTSLTDHVIENYEIWRTSKQSRIDYNDGYVKSIVKIGSKPYRFGIKYTIHPEASMHQEIETVCNTLLGSKHERAYLETILPEDPGFYVAVGNETINDNECVKFEYDSVDTGADTRNTIWAYYDDNDKVWVPVRYEVLEFNVWLGSKDKHEIWDFFDYQSSFSFRSVFAVDSYECPADSKLPSDSKKSEASTKNLFFVNPEKDDHVEQLFRAYKKEFSKTYADKVEHTMRKSIFKKNLRKIIENNRRNLGYKLALNQFADKTSAEMLKHKGLIRRPEGKVGNVPFPYDKKQLTDLVNDLPAEYDLRLMGLVTDVKNQETCGSCWTFGTTAAVEGALARINGGKLMSLSNQALVDCAWAFGAAGCDGGSDNAAYEWMMQYGLPTEAEYGSYLNQDGPCNILNMTNTFPIRGYIDVTPLSIGALKIAVVNHGPLSVSVHATTAFSLYNSGIFYDSECDEQHLDHEVTLVGYGERDGDTFWILKNSWGPTWGMGGYMYISARDNNCGVATEPTYVVF